MIVNRRTAVFVTRTKHVLVARARDQGWSPAQTVIAPDIKFAGILATWAGSDKQNVKAVFVARDRASPGGTFTF